MKAPREQNIIWFTNERRKRRRFPSLSFSEERSPRSDDEGDEFGILFERWFLEDRHGNCFETNLRPYQVARLFEFDSGVVSGVRIER